MMDNEKSLLKNTKVLGLALERMVKIKVMYYSQCDNKTGLIWFLDQNYTILGKEIIAEIEQLQVDKKNRPLVDARVFNSGELVPKSKVC